MANFNLFKTNLLEAEGGYQKNPTDWRGNTNSKGVLVGTNRGISAPQYEDWIKRVPTEQDMRNITKAEALQIYEKIYWNKLVKAPKINSQAIAETLTDMVINAKSKGGKIMQQTLNDSFGFHLVEDNIIGNKTIKAINSVSEKKLFQAYTTARNNYYENVKNWDFNLYKTYIRGWKKRVSKLYNKHINTVVDTIKNNPKSSFGLFFLIAAALLFIKNKKQKK